MFPKASNSVKEFRRERETNMARVMDRVVCYF